MAAGVLLAVALAFGIGMYTGVSGNAGAPATAAIPGTPAADLAQFWRAWEMLDQNFVQSGSSTIPTDQEKIYGAIEGLTESYGDPYTVFLPPADAKAFNEEISGSFSGVGMELGIRDGALTVIAPIKGTPADRAGVLSGDIVLAINGKAAREMPVEEAVKLIRGEKGTTVELVFERKGVAEPIVRPIVRETITVPLIVTRTEGASTSTASAGGAGTGDVFIIEMYSFSANSPELFRNALRDFIKSGKTKLILDLRGNPGGYLEAAVQMASYFLPVGDIIVTEDYKGNRDNTAHRSLGYNVFAGRNLDMAVLINEGSASASEILAGALQQHGVAKLVGKKTFGKGSVQQLLELGNGAELKVTVAHWLTPNGTSISAGGLTPDIEAERTPEDRTNKKDPQLDAAKKWLATQ